MSFCPKKVIPFLFFKFIIFDFFDFFDFFKKNQKTLKLRNRKKQLPKN